MIFRTKQRELQDLVKVVAFCCIPGLLEEKETNQDPLAMYPAASFPHHLVQPRHDSLPRSVHFHVVSKLPGFLTLDYEKRSVTPPPPLTKNQRSSPLKRDESVSWRSPKCQHNV